MAEITKQTSSRRRPHSASGVVMETASYPRTSFVEAWPSPKPQQSSSPELEFTDKLKALKELIASSKTHRRPRNSHAEKHPARIIAKRSGPNFCEAEKVGEKVKFTARSFESGNGALTDKDLIAREDLESEFIRPPRPHSSAESYSHLLSRDLAQMGKQLEQDWLASERAFASSSSPKRVSFRKDDPLEARRSHSSLGYYHHEVPERDWSIPSRTVGSSLHRNSEFLERREKGVEWLSVDSVREASLLTTSSAVSLSDIKARELMKQKEAVYRQYSSQEETADTTPPEHDCTSTESTPRPVQTNVHITDQPQRSRPRPHSADVTSRTLPSETQSFTIHASSGGIDGEKGHWTQLLSQKRDKNDSVSMSSSPATVQSNVSLEFAHRASPHTFLLQEAARQLEREELQVKDGVRKSKQRETRRNRESTSDNGDGIFGLEEQLQDDEVANIFQHPKTKKKIIIKRGSVRVVHEPESNSSSFKSSHKRPSQESATKSKHPLLNQSSQDSDDTLVLEVEKDEHLMTLDKLKSLLRSRRSDSRPSSRASSASLSSPSPMKAFHHAKHPNIHNQDSLQPQSRTRDHSTRRGEDSEINGDLGHMKSRYAESESSKPVQRKVIRRPPSVTKSKENSQLRQAQRNASSSQQSIVGERDGRLLSDAGSPLKSSIIRQKSTSDRPSSAPQFSSRAVSSSSVPSSTKSINTTKNQGYTDGPVRRTSSSARDVKVGELLARPRSSLDFSQGSREKSAETLAAAQSLRNSVQRLHQEISMRVNQDGYLVQGLISKADAFGELEDVRNGGVVNGHVNGIPHHEEASDAESGEVCRKLNFEEDAGASSASKRMDVTGARRSQSCFPFGKRLGAGMVDTGSIPSLAGSVSSVDGTDGDFKSEDEVKKRKTTSLSSSLKTSVSQQRQLKMTSSDDHDENSFLRNVQQLSKDQGTSTPREEVDRGQQRASKAVLSSKPPKFRSSAMRNIESPGLDENFMMPERLSADNLRPRRPASVGAIPIRPSEGVPIGDDAADLILSQLGNASMVHLLQQLYTADDITRHAIIIKAQYFRQWRTTVHSWKRQRQIYAESLKLAHKHLVRRLQSRFFQHWRTSADDNRRRRMAESIHRQHMLKKGFEGLRWAVLRSKHQARTLKMKVDLIALKASFATWQAGFESRREGRMRSALARWREYTHEEKSVREMQQKQNERLMYQTMVVWKEIYDRDVKERVAEKYLRNLHKRNMRRSVFIVWQLALLQSRRASQHFRSKRLQRTLQAWHQGAQISRVERQRDTATSMEHWRHTTTRHTFTRWFHQLHQCRAAALANKTLSKKTFDHWKQEWQKNSERRKEIEASITSSRLRKCLLTWRRNVVDRRRKQRQAVFLLESCLMRSTLLSWRCYAAYKTGFRGSLQQHVKVIQSTTLSRCFQLWREKLDRCLDDRRKRELWSLSCVRKMTATWRHKCHIRRLQVILEETEPVRQLGLLRRMLGKWLEAKGRAEEETAEVQASCHILQRCHLQRRFQEWRLATNRALVIRPLVLRRQRLLLTWCFDAWCVHVKSKLETHKRAKMFQQNQLSRAFARWRRQYHCQQVSRLAQQNFMQRLALCLLLQWREILHRKHQARLYHSANLLRQTFQYWQSRTTLQLREKAQEQAEQELSEKLKREYFHQWWSGVQAQIVENNDAVSRLHQRLNHNHIRSTFYSWRRSLHAHVVSRAYKRTSTQRLLHSVLLEWHEASSQSLCSAVHHFAQRLGLQQQQQQQQEWDGFSAEGSIGALSQSLELGDLLELGGGDQFGSPCSSSATSVKRLFASDHSATSERFYGNDLDFDRASLLNSGLQETMEERRNKNLRMQEVAMTFVTRLSHWPISLAFSQWQEYTLRQRQLRQFAHQVQENHRAVAVAMTFRMWRKQFHNNQKATNLMNWRLQHRSLTMLLEYSRHRKVKAALAKRARGHLIKHVLGKIFPWWLAKAQEQKHQRTILHLWSTATPEEAELLPLEASLSRQIRQRSLRACWEVWRVRFLFLIKLKKVYHAQLFGRVLSVWQDWASLRQAEERKSNNLLESRRTKMAFKLWCERLHQKHETERRFKATQRADMLQAFHCWREWATVSKQQRRGSKVLEGRVNSLCVKTHFLTWRRLTHTMLTIRSAHHTHLMHSVFVEWRLATQEGKQLRQTILSFRAASLTRLVGQLFYRWQQRYQQRQRQHMRREERAKQCALRCGKKWRRKAQKTRGRKLIVVFKYSRLTRMFNHWRSSLGRVEELKQRQTDYTTQKNKELIGRMLAEWRQKLQSTVMTRNFTHKFLVTVLLVWQVYAKASKERRIRGLALQRALRERNLRLYFVYWRHLSVRVRSLQNNVEQRLQLRVLQAWSYIVRRRCSQRRMGEKFARLRQHRQVVSAFAVLRSRFDYCQALRETADSMCAKRDRNLASLAMERWKDALDNVIAKRFYVRLLSIRTARTWLRFVDRVKRERQHDAEQLSKAVKYHDRHICHTVLAALKQEVKVTQQLQRRRLRLVIKVATGWKRITDMAVTAVVVEEERLYAGYWRAWRLAWVRRQAANKDAALHRRQVLSQAFISWRSLCPSHVTLDQQQSTVTGRRTPRSVSSDTGRDSPTMSRSMLPVPVSSARRSASDSSY
ncbi:hypothetical protein V1264_007892 [Littorina saxatilis]|uniref:Sfi1 spindle body domain-containing protein n=1 Tax=Littorina saxatilis TaxID=31220 RepID=A0AAN9G3T9_9CAEN